MSRSSHGMSQDHPRSSRQRYRRFVQDYKLHRLDDALEGQQQKEAEDSANSGLSEPHKRPRGKVRREYLREYAHWLWPHRYTVAAVFAFALLAGGLEMIQPLFMRFIVDRV